MSLIPFFLISTISIIVAMYFKQSFAKVLPSALFLIVIVIYLGGYIGDLRIGVYLLLLTMFVFIGYILYLIIKKDYVLLNQIKNIILSPGLVIYILIFSFIYFYNVNASFSFWDEWSHWGPYVKDMVLRNKFYNTNDHIATVHLSYPPFKQLFEYLYIVLVNDFSMQNIYRANQILCFSLGIMLFYDMKFKKNVIENIKIIVIMILSIAYFILINRIIDFQSNPIKSIYGDAFLGLTFGFFMVNILQFDFTDKFKLFNVILSGIALVFSKQMGIALFLLGIFILFIMTMLDKKLTMHNFIRGIILFSVPLMFVVSWKIIVCINKIQDQFDLHRKINVKELINILFFGGGVEWQRTTIANFLNWIFQSKYMGINVFMILMMFIFTFVFISLFAKDRYGKKIVIISIGFVLGMLLYMFAILCLYFYTFSEYESIHLASLWRYVSTYLIGITFFIGFVALEIIIYYKKKNILYIVLLFIFDIIIFVTSNFANHVSYIPKTYEQSDNYIYREDFKYMNELPINSNILVIAQGDQGLLGLRFKFKFFDKNFTSASFGDKIYYNPDIWTKDLLKKEFVEYIKKFDYVYFYYVDDNFKNKYSDVFIFIPKNRVGVYKVNEVLK